MPCTNSHYHTPFNFAHLLVDDNEAALLAVLVVAVADLLLQLDDPIHALRDEVPLSRQKLFSLARRLVEQTRVDFPVIELSFYFLATNEYLSRLFVFERDVARKNEGVLDALGHIGVARAVVEHESAHERRVHVHTVLHLLDLHHVQVDRLVRLSDGQHCVHDALGDVIG
jgi:hypothetical protein